MAYGNFHGGKVEKDESYEQALKREIKEELDVDIKITEYIGTIEHHYSNKDIELILYKANLISEDIKLLEHEKYQWITVKDKNNFQFAGADIKVFDFI